MVRFGDEPDPDAAAFTSLGRFFKLLKMENIAFGADPGADDVGAGVDVEAAGTFLSWPLGLGLGLGLMGAASFFCKRSVRCSLWSRQEGKTYGSGGLRNNDDFVIIIRLGNNAKSARIIERQGKETATSTAAFFAAAFLAGAFFGFGFGFAAAGSESSSSSDFALPLPLGAGFFCKGERKVA